MPDRGVKGRRGNAAVRSVIPVCSYRLPHSLWNKGWGSFMEEQAVAASLQQPATQHGRRAINKKH